MSRWILALAALLAPGLCRAGTQSVASTQAANDDKGTYFGVLFSSVPEALYAHLPDLPREQGVLVTYVLPDSPAAKAGLQRHDILLQYDEDKIRDCEQFARKINDDKPDRVVKLVLFRAGKPTTAEVTLTAGPMLRIAPPSRPAIRDVEEVARGIAKTSAPASVNVAAKPLDGGQLKVTIEYYQDETGRLQTVTCTGTPAEIEAEIQKLPSRVQPLARAGFQRIYQYHLPNKDGPPAPTSPASR
jgi:hypothetical protein